MLKADDVIELIGDMIRAIIEYAKLNREEFVESIKGAQGNKVDAEVRQKKKRLSELQQRASELEKLLCRIYEDNVSGKISDERFAMLDSQYGQEQSENRVEMSQIEKYLANKSQDTSADQKFVALVDRYMNVEELTTIIAPITSSIKKCSMPVHVPVLNSNLYKDSIVLCEQIQVMDKSRLEKQLCRLTDKEMKAVNNALAVSVGEYELPDKR